MKTIGILILGAMLTGCAPMTADQHARMDKLVDNLIRLQEVEAMRQAAVRSPHYDVWVIR